MPENTILRETPILRDESGNAAAVLTVFNVFPRPRSATLTTFSVSKGHDYDVVMSNRAIL